jgi:(5-formylfuran-3-yl)methyl phosphate synthase
MTKLLISVQSANEVEDAILGGADLIDIKAPQRGSLGRADLSVLIQVCKQVDDRLPISAAMGEWSETSTDDWQKLAPLGIRYLKWGLSNQSKIPSELIEQKKSTSSKVVLCGYADWERAKSPSPQDLVQRAKEYHFEVMLFDTWKKDGTTLLDWLKGDEIASIVRELHQNQIAIALAGSLQLPQIEQLVPLQPDWIAVRGAACREGKRNHAIDPNRVREIKAILEAPTNADLPIQCEVF